jgi:hypothetical protein
MLLCLALRPLAIPLFALESLVVRSTHVVAVCRAAVRIAAARIVSCRALARALVAFTAVQR